MLAAGPALDPAAGSDHVTRLGKRLGKVIDRARYHHAHRRDWNTGRKQQEEPGKKPQPGEDQGTVPEQGGEGTAERDTAGDLKAALPAGRAREHHR